MKEQDNSKQTKALLAELLFDLKGRKTKRLDWMSIADKCYELVGHYDNSVTQTAKKLRVSPSLLSSILRLRKLDPRVKELVREGDVLFDSAHRLNVIKNGDRQFEVARLLVGVSNKEQRDIIQHALRSPEVDLVDFRRRVTGEKTRRENLRILIIPMREELYRSLEKSSLETKRPIEKLMSEIVSAWLEARSRSK